MSIEQTNQLILLILNSVLMLLLSSILLGGAWLRQSTLLQQLDQTRSHHRRLTQTQAQTPVQIPVQTQKRSAETSHAELQTDQRQIWEKLAAHPSSTADADGRVINLDLAALKQIRDRRQQLSQQYQWSHVGMLMLHASLLIFSTSLLALTLRSLLAFDGLISTALFLFTLGAAGLLTGIGCVLVDFAKGDRNDNSAKKTLASMIQTLNRQWVRSTLKTAAHTSGKSRLHAKSPQAHLSKTPAKRQPSQQVSS